MPIDKLTTLDETIENISASVSIGNNVVTYLSDLRNALNSFQPPVEARPMFKKLGILSVGTQFVDAVLNRGIIVLYIRFVLSSGLAQIKFHKAYNTLPPTDFLNESTLVALIDAPENMVARIASRIARKDLSTGILEELRGQYGRYFYASRK